jgi:hypothetical protein
VDAHAFLRVTPAGITAEAATLATGTGPVTRLRVAEITERRAGAAAAATPPLADSVTE